MNLNTSKDIASELFLALKKQEMIKPLTERYPEIDINDAYQISRKFLSLREKEGEKIIIHLRVLVVLLRGKRG